MTVQRPKGALPFAEPGTNVTSAPLPNIQCAAVISRSRVGLETTPAVQLWKEEPER